MQSGLGLRLVRLVYWYLNYSYIWAISMVVFLTYVYMYDRYAVLSCRIWSGESVFHLLARASSSVLEPLILAIHCSLLASIYFAYDPESGYSYLRHMIGSKKTIEFLAKYIASLILSVSPILASKLLMWFVWDPGLVLKSPLEFLCTVLSLAFEIAIYVTYVLGFLVPLAVLVRKPLYLITAFVFYTYAVETGGFGGPLGFLQIYSGLVTGYTFFFETLRKYTVDLRLLLSLALLVVSLHVYIRGEVRWR